MKKSWGIAAIWLPVAVAITIFCGLVYVTVQQSLRQSANDPQIQMAEDAANALEGGAPADSVLPSTRIDVAASLAPFTVVFNDSGNVVASSGLLHGQSLQLPAGVLDNVRQKGQSRLTLQPESAVRIASVIVRFSGAKPGFVLAGRSLRETEVRTTQTRTFVGLAWVAALVVTLVVVFLCSTGTLWQ
jgi:hypothetical protein